MISVMRRPLRAREAPKHESCTSRVLIAVQEGGSGSRSTCFWPIKKGTAGNSKLMNSCYRIGENRLTFDSDAVIESKRTQRFWRFWAETRNDG